MKKILLLLITLFSIKSFSQKKSNIQFFNKKGEKVSQKDGVYSETAIKINDSLWEIKRYRKNGSLLSISFSRSQGKKEYIGQSITYNIKDSISNILYYNDESQKHGRYLKWFANGEKSLEGLFQKNKKEGIWKYYHFNGKIAARGIYKNDSIVRGEYFDEEGKKIPHNTQYCKKEASFKGGFKKFKRKVNSNNILNIKSLRGKELNVNFIVGPLGTITDVYFDDFLPLEVENKIVKHFKKIKGWNPAFIMHRKVSQTFRVLLKFNKFQ